MTQMWNNKFWLPEFQKRTGMTFNILVLKFGLMFCYHDRCTVCAAHKYENCYGIWPFKVNHDGCPRYICCLNPI